MDQTPGDLPMILGLDFMGRFDSVAISLRAPSKESSAIQEQYIEWKPYKGTPYRWRLYRRPERHTREHTAHVFEHCAPYDSDDDDDHESSSDEPRTHVHVYMPDHLQGDESESSIVDDELGLSPAQYRTLRNSYAHYVARHEQRWPVAAEVDRHVDGAIHVISAEAARQRDEAALKSLAQAKEHLQAAEAKQECYDARLQKAAEEIMAPAMSSDDDAGRFDNDAPELRGLTKDAIKLKDGAKPTTGWRKKYIGEIGTWLHQTIIEMKRHHQVRNSTSAYDNPVLVVPKKKNGVVVGYRLCFDMRLLNKQTIPMGNAPPNVWDVLHALRGARYMSDLDLTSGYYQAELPEEDKHKTAFRVRTQHGTETVEMEVMSMGLVNSQAIFIKLVNTALKDELHKTIFTLSDDVTIATKTYAEHIRVLKYVAQQARKYGFRFQPKKCKFGLTKMVKFGWIVGNDELRIDPARVAALTKLERPQTKSDVRTFLGLVQYWRMSIKDCARICTPLSALLKDTAPDRLIWGAEEDAAWVLLKQILASDTVMSPPDFDKVFYIDTDAGPDGVGAALYQVQDGRKRAVWYVSAQLNDTQLAYSTTEKELYAVIYALKKVHSIIGIGTHFTVSTDARNVLWLYDRPSGGESAVTMGVSALRLTSWVMQLQQHAHQMTIRHIPAEQNKAADALSRARAQSRLADLRASAALRMARIHGGTSHDVHVRTDEHMIHRGMRKLRGPLIDAERDTITASRKTWARIPALAGTRLIMKDDELEPGAADEDPNYLPRAHRDALPAPRRPPSGPVIDGDIPSAHIAAILAIDGVPGDLLPDAAESEEPDTEAPKPKTIRATRFGALDGDADIKEMTTFPLDSEIAVAQEKEFDDLWECLEVETPPLGLPNAYKRLSAVSPTMITREGVENTTTRIIVVDPKAEGLLVPYIPPSLRKRVIESAHKSLIGGHQRAQVTGERVLKTAWWPSVGHDVDNYCRICEACNGMRRFTKHKARPHTMWSVRRPAHTVHLDFIGPFHPAEGGETFMLTMIDRFSRFAVLVPVHDTMHTTAARAFVDNWCRRFSPPVQIVTDNGTHFSGKMWLDLKDFLWMKHARVAVYHPQSNGAIERIHSTLKAMLTKYCQANHKFWASIVPQMEFALNTSISSAHGMTPFKVMMGWEPRHPFEGVRLTEAVLLDPLAYGRWHSAWIRDVWDFVASHDLDDKYKRYLNSLPAQQVAEFVEGQKVWCRQPIASEPNRAIGPYTILRDVSHGSGSVFDIRHPLNGKILRRRHAIDLRPALQAYDVGTGQILRTGAEKHEPASNDVCLRCGEGSTVDGGDLMCCDTCPLTYHAKCTGLSRPPSGKWHCPKCMRSTQNLAASYDAMYDDDIHHRAFDRSKASKPETDRDVIRALQAAPTTDGDKTSRGRVRKSRGRATSATTDDDAVVRTPVKRRRAASADKELKNESTTRSHANVGDRIEHLYRYSDGQDRWCPGTVTKGRDDQGRYTVTWADTSTGQRTRKQPTTQLKLPPAKLGMTWDFV